jgi:hypothetical protein
MKVGREVDDDDDDDEGGRAGSEEAEMREMMARADGPRRWTTRLVVSKFAGMANRVNDGVVAESNPLQ